jgi:hypothetical protein
MLGERDAEDLLFARNLVMRRLELEVEVGGRLQ